MLLKNKNIRLRALEPEDLKLLYKWENDSSIWEVSNTKVPFSLYQLKRYIEGAQAADIYTSKQLRLITERISDGKPLGMIDLFDFDAFHLRAGIGISINEKEERKKHYASESLQIFTDYAFSVLNLRLLYCDISEDNTASLKLFKSQGFNVQGEKLNWLKVGNSFKNVFFLQKLNPNFTY